MGFITQAPRRRAGGCIGGNVVRVNRLHKSLRRILKSPCWSGVWRKKELFKELFKICSCQKREQIYGVEICSYHPREQILNRSLNKSPIAESPVQHFHLSDEEKDLCNLFIQHTLPPMHRGRASPGRACLILLPRESRRAGQGVDGVIEQGNVQGLVGVVGVAGR